MTAFESIRRQRITLSRFSLLYLSALPSHPTSISAPLTYPQCLAVATLISFKLLQKKKKEKEKTNKQTTKASSHPHLTWNTQAQLYISLCCNPNVGLQPLPTLPSTCSTPSRIQGGNEGRRLMPVPNKETADTIPGLHPCCGCSKLQA